MSPNVAILSAGTTESGGDRVLAQVANALVDAGASVRWVVPATRADRPPELTERVRLVRIRARSRWRASFAIAWASRRDDVVIAGSPLLAVLARTARWPNRAGVTWFHQGWALDVGRGPVSLAAIRLSEAMLRRTRGRTVVVSESLLREVPNATLLPNGIDLERFSPAPRRRGQETVGSVVSAGKLHLLPTLLRVSEELRRRRPQAEFKVLTPGRRRFGKGWTEDGRIIPPADFLRDCDVFVSVAERDGFALPPLEAMACGVPVVAMPSAGLLDYARGNQNALLVGTGNPRDVAHEISRVLSDPALRTRLREQGLQTAQKYSLARAQAGYRDYFLARR